MDTDFQPVASIEESIRRRLGVGTMIRSRVVERMTFRTLDQRQKERSNSPTICFTALPLQSGSVFL